MQINKFIDHTILKAVATKDDVKKICDEAIKYDFKSVCINPANVALAKELSILQLVKSIEQLEILLSLIPAIKPKLTFCVALTVILK